MNNIITLKDGTLVEIEVEKNQYLEISDEHVVDSSLEKMNDLLEKLTEPAIKFCKSMNEKNSIENIKIGAGIKIGAEGNFILAKSSMTANINIQIQIKPNQK